MRSCWASTASPDWGPIYSGFLGLLLLAAALTAIGLIVSRASPSNQIVAAVVAMGIGILLWMIDTLGYLLPDPFDAIVTQPLAGRALHPVRHRRHLPVRRRDSS